MRPHKNHAYVFIKYASLTVLCLCKWLFLPGPPPPPDKSDDLFLACQLENEDSFKSEDPFGGGGGGGLVSWKF